MFQKTIKQNVSITGVGAHSGIETKISLIPAPENHGIVFKRTDLTSKNIIPALWSYVTDTRLCTTISNISNVSVSTIEHLMAALSAMEIDNLLIEINGAEVPILDGSAHPYLSILENIGTTTQNEKKSYLKILKPISVKQGESWAQIKPAQDGFSLHYTFRNRSTNAFERYTSQDALKDFKNHLAPARTFGFLEDVEKLYAAGLAKGSSLENAVVFDEGKVLNPEGLRFDNECARHKALDVIGDLFLAGIPIIGHFEGYCSGHSLNNMLLEALLKDRSAWSIITKDPPASHPHHPGPYQRHQNISLNEKPLRFGTF
ncbi:MAG: UDP-3-O-acyl-N-acetylglucosamine deacetylase [Alphaproteobacteria bacterium]